MKICLIGSGGIALSTAFDGTIVEINENDEIVGKVESFNIQMICHLR